MFADPQHITVDGNDIVLTKINQDQYSSEYLLRTSIDEFRLRIRNTSYLNKTTGRNTDRHNVEFTWTVFPVAPETKSIIRKTYLVVENAQGDSLDDPVNAALGLFGWATNTNLTKLANFES
jgi:hypothetical protein